jgi:hypothetical protein
MEPLALVPPPVQVLPGTAAIGATGVTVHEFWAWALSDLRTNSARSRLAECLVAVALNVHHRPRVEWDSHDVTARDGTRVEVKSSAYLQAWDQARLSRISFGGLRARTWWPQAGCAADVTYNADVYVFGLQTAVTHETYDALNLDQWRFWVASAVTIAETGQDQVSLSRVQALCGDHVEHGKLAQAIAAAARTQPNPASVCPPDVGGPPCHPYSTSDSNRDNQRCMLQDWCVDIAPVRRPAGTRRYTLGAAENRMPRRATWPDGKRRACPRRRGQHDVAGAAHLPRRFAGDDRAGPRGSAREGRCGRAQLLQRSA